MDSYTQTYSYASTAIATAPEREGNLQNSAADLSIANDNPDMLLAQFKRLLLMSDPLTTLT